MTSKETQHREELVKEYMASKNDSLKESILVAYTSLVEYIARKLAYNKNDVPDLIQVGSMGLLKALKTYDVDRDIAFSTYSSTIIMGEIRHYIRDKGRIVKLPRKLQEQYSKIQKYIQKRSQELEKSPTTSEIAQSLGLSEEDVLESIEAAQSFQIISLDRPLQSHHSKSSGETFSLIDKIGIEDKYNNTLDKMIISQALHDLTDRQKKLIHLRFYEGLTQKEISVKLSISQMHVSRLLSESLKKLRRKIRIDP